LRQAQIAAIGEWGSHPGARFAYLKNIKQPALVVSGNHDVNRLHSESLYLVQNMPNAKLILYPNANHGSWYEYHEDFVFETNRFWMKATEFLRSPLALQPAEVQMFLGQGA